MSIKPLLRILLILIIALFCFLLLNTVIVTEAERILARIMNAKEMLEKEDRNLLVLVSKDFEFGDYRYDDLRSNLPHFYDKFDRIKVELSDCKVFIDGDVARCSLKARVIAWTDSMPVLLFGELLSKSPAEIRFRMENQDWLIGSINAD